MTTPQRRKGVGQFGRAILDCRASLTPTAGTSPGTVRTRSPRFRAAGQEQVDAFEHLTPIVRAEEGCLQYDLHRVVDDPDRFVLVELWSSQEALAAHDVTAHMVAADATSPAFRAGAAQMIEVEAEPVA